jgi:hypothetical protein
MHVLFHFGYIEQFYRVSFEVGVSNGVAAAFPSNPACIALTAPSI